jgi:hypothetical protein
MPADYRPRDARGGGGPPDAPPGDRPEFRPRHRANAPEEFGLPDAVETTGSAAPAFMGISAGGMGCPGGAVEVGFAGTRDMASRYVSRPAAFAT